ncbi:hypothetical protein [Agrococcus jejuensis]|uniref:DUF4386 domain-containing protein n=1 Tax=Agrococcus jejuensis TaxID=399736 RepID=A0A1G8B9Y7_9MICO|nr:hypothetical protein [Agrococcus jejuensis]SDH29901.1 hypothetical protein SAMN04489720_0773 [Agrococcus jejuensis]
MTASTSPTLDVAARPSGSHPATLAAVVVFALLVVALVARTAFLLWEPPFDGAVHYDAVAPLGDAYWGMNLLVGGPSFAISWVAVAILAARLAHGRSALVTIAASVVIGVGGILFALVVTAEVLPFALAANPEVLSEAEGRAAFDVLNAHLDVVAPGIVGSQAAVAVGMLVLLVVSLVTRALPRWLAIAGLAYLVVFAAVPFELLPRAATIASDLVQTLLVASIGWCGLRATVARR